jgi:hypothetical protein
VVKINTNPWRTILILIPVKDICGKSGVISGKDVKKKPQISSSV